VERARSATSRFSASSVRRTIDHSRTLIYRRMLVDFAQVTMASDGFDIDAYLTRLSYSGPREPTLRVLASIVSAHAAAIPYEDIDVLLNRGIALDIGVLQQKLVQHKRGGYCFEQNTLLAAALETLGFRITRLGGRVIRGLPVSTETVRGHKLLRVDLPEGPYIADVGFGSLTSTGPLALRLEEPQATPHETFRLMPFDPKPTLATELIGVGGCIPEVWLSQIGEQDHPQRCGAKKIFRLL
jgi:N-hydroxyarylamine O-acetyltransferase